MSARHEEFRKTLPGKRIEGNNRIRAEKKEGDKWIWLKRDCRGSRKNQSVKTGKERVGVFQSRSVSGRRAQGGESAPHQSS